MFCRNCGEQMNENQAVCLKCGVEKGKGKGYCPNCGNQVAEEAVICVACGVSLKKEENKAAEGTVNPAVAKTIKTRSIVTAIILYFVTCGIYGIYWFVCLTNEMNRMSDTKDTSGGMCFLLNLITCNIYGIYWGYRMGIKRDKMMGEENANSKVLYLVLCLVLPIAAYALAQDSINKAVAKATAEQ